MYEKIKRFYELGLWTETMIGQAAKKGWITATEYEQITGNVYEG